jgi:ACS family tartrate transporter-like MFS transporter
MALLGGVALAASAFTPSLYLAVFLICVSAFGIWGQQAVFWTLPAAYLKERSAAAGVAFINMAAGVGGFCGPYLVGVARDATNSYALALVVLASTSFIVAILVTFIRVDEKAHSRKPLMQALQK